MAGAAHYMSDEVGVNRRLDELQAAILRVKLRHLDAQNMRRPGDRRAPMMRRWRAATVRPPARRRGRRPRVSSVRRARARPRRRCRRDCATAGIGTGVHYPVPVHLQPAYRGRVALGPSGCTASERASAEVLSLPMFPELTDEQVEIVCAALSRLT